MAVHDAVAVLEAVPPGTLRTTADADGGGLRPRPGPRRRRCAMSGRLGGPPVQVALDADTDRVLAEILARLRRLG